MNIKKATLVRSTLLVIGLFGAVTGLAFAFSNGQINLIPIPGLTYANLLSGIVIGILGILIVIAEVGELYNGYKKKTLL